jgi:MFS family permease
MGLLPDGDPPGTSAPGEAPRSRRRSLYGMEVGEAMRTPAFYLLVLAAAAQSFSHSSWNALQIPHFKVNGFSIGAVGVLLGAYGTCQMFLRPSIGWLGDRMGRRRVFLATFAFHGIGLLAFAHMGPDTWWLIPVYFVVFGLGHASQNTLGQSIMADYYGTKRFATLRGLRQSLVLPAGILAPIFSGLMFDRTGTYVSGFTILSVVSLVGWAFQASVRRPFYDDLPEHMKSKVPAPAPAEKPA